MHLKQAYLPLFIGSLVLTTACNNSGEVINDAVTQRERDKGYSIIDSKIISKKENDGHLIVIFQTIDGDSTIVTDTVSFTHTGDGMLTQEK